MSIGSLRKLSRRQRGGIRAFHPRQIPSLVINLDATDGVTMGGSNKVSSIVDASGADNSAAQSSSTAKFTWTPNVINGWPAFVGNGTGTFMEITSNPFNVGPAVDFAMFLVFLRNANETGSHRMIQPRCDVNTFVLAIESSEATNNNYLALSSGKASVNEQKCIDSAATPSNTPTIVAATQRAGVMSLWKNGVLITSTTYNGTTNGAADSATGWIIGANEYSSSPSLFSNLAWTNAMVFKGLVPDSEVMQIFDWFSQRYNI